MKEFLIVILISGTTGFLTSHLYDWVLKRKRRKQIRDKFKNIQVTKVPVIAPEDDIQFTYIGTGIDIVYPLLDKIKEECGTHSIIDSYRGPYHKCEECKLYDYVSFQGDKGCIITNTMPIDLDLKKIQERLK